MQHLNDDELILCYYGEAAHGADDHVHECSECRLRFQAVQRALNVVDVPVPGRPADYGMQVWDRLAPKLGASERRWWLPARWWLRARWWVASAALASLVTGAFLAGRFLPDPAVGRPDAAGDRVLAGTLGDHLERSQNVLSEFANAEPKTVADFQFERERAENLLEANRLYRRAAATRGDLSALYVLDDLERVLLEVVNSPAAIPAAELDALQERMRRQGLIFKIRVVGTRLMNESDRL